MPEEAMNTSKSDDRERLEANREFGRRFFAEQDRLRGGPALDMCATRYTARIGVNPPMDRAGHDAFAREFYEAFPDIHHEIEQVMVEDDSVMVRFVLHGTQTRAFCGIAPTNRKVAVAAHALLRLENGKVRDLLAIFDEAGMLRQLGALPAA
jgi:predicted ester cyclase